MIWPLRRAARVAPKQPAVRFEDVELTYAQTWERCRRLAGALRGLGVERGDRVAVVAQNSHRYLELYQAIPGAGMVLVPLNHRHADAEVRYALEDSGARVVFAAREIGGLPASVEHVVDAGDGYEELLDGADPVDFPDDVSEDDLAGIFYTGGTTGGAKGVMLRHRALVSNAMHLQAALPFEPETCGGAPSATETLRRARRRPGRAAGRPWASRRGSSTPWSARRSSPARSARWPSAGRT